LECVKLPGLFASAPYLLEICAKPFHETNIWAGYRTYQRIHIPIHPWSRSP
jgi:hypothetical protein